LREDFKLRRQLGYIVEQNGVGVGLHDLDLALVDAVVGFDAHGGHHTLRLDRDGGHVLPHVFDVQHEAGVLEDGLRGREGDVDVHGLARVDLFA